MSQKDSATPAPEVKEEQIEAVESKEETIADAMGDIKDTPKVPDQIPYDRFSEKVAENKELKERIEALESKAANDDMSKKEIKSDLSDIADEYNLDGDVLDKISRAIQAKATAEIEERLAPLTQRETQAKRDAAFEKMYTNAMTNSPEYQDVANKEVIKQLALNPANANKTFSQLLEMMYGGVVTRGEKKTMESTAPGKSDETIDKVDYNRAQKDDEYFSKIKADPQLKAEYNAQMLQNIQRHM